MIIPNDYYIEQIEIKLTQAEINLIIDELERTEHNLFVLLGYEKIINKLGGKKYEQVVRAC